MYDRVLFPTDASEGSEVAAEHAMTVAAQFDAPMHALYVIDTTVSMGADAYSGPTLAGMRAAGEEHVEELTERADREGVEATSAVREGPPAGTIVDESRPGDVVVMGTHGRTGLDRYLIGSTTEKVVRTADVPVVTVPVGGDRESGD